MWNKVLGVMVGATLAGCAASHQVAQRPLSVATRTAPVAAQPAPKPKDLGGDAVKIVAHRPPTRLYKFVGRVEARARTVDIVDVALAADADLRRQAKVLGADVVKIDFLAPPRDHARPRTRVILAGNAYRAVVD